jgi:hypothetical protein
VKSWQGTGHQDLPDFECSRPKQTSDSLTRQRILGLICENLKKKHATVCMKLCRIYCESLHYSELLQELLQRAQK